MFTEKTRERTLGRRDKVKKRKARDRRKFRKQQSKQNKGGKRLKTAANQPKLPPSEILMLDYHWRPFHLFHKDLERTGYDAWVPHPVRKQYWSLVPKEHYQSDDARSLLLQYARVVEERIKEVIQKASLGYWLHLYRRIGPYPIVQRDSAVTVGITRAVLEAGFQKYARLDPCDRVGLSTSVPIQQVLGGILQSPEFEFERKRVSEYAQLVMLDFSAVNLKELYDLEKLAFEIWRAGAHLRCVGKGAGLNISNDVDRVADDRSDELDTLVRSFDARCRDVMGLPATLSGTVLDRSEAEATGLAMLPNYNLSNEELSDLQRGYFEKIFGVRVERRWRPNFHWSVFDLRGYYRAHEPLASGFAKLHGASYHSALALLAALSFRTLRRSLESGGGTLFPLWQKAYEGPYGRSYVTQELQNYGPAAKNLLGMSDDEWKRVDLDEGMHFWSLRENKRSTMDLMYPGPHNIFLPFGNDRVFIDYGWLTRRLYDLFVGVSIPDQNFKGQALEELVRGDASALPVGPCTNAQGERKQIDAAFRVGDRLLIVECRAAGRSIGFDRGDPGAIRFRQQIVDRTLDDVDEKARWLAASPRGRNYDISWATAIIPVGVTPFVEFMPSTSSRYWLLDGLARVLTPQELREALESGSILKVLQNVTPVQSS